MRALTSRQQEILDFIRNHQETLGMPPTRAEIARSFGFASANAAEEHVKALARKGLLMLEPGSSRGIRLVEQLGLPLIGSVAAGSPLLAIENVQQRYQLDQSLFSPKADFLLKVRGLSMSGVGILDGDLVAVHKTTEVQHGQVVVARLEEEVTVKRFWKKAGEIRLISENPDYAPIELGGRELTIEGLVVGVVRTQGI